jgi:hypothetical protein
MQTDMVSEPSSGLEVVLKGCHSKREMSGTLMYRKLKAL